MREQTELTLNQQLQQSENAYKNAQQAFKFAQTSSENALKQANLGLSSAESQFEGLKNGFLSQKLALLGVMQGVLETADSLMGITEYYQEQLKGQEIYFGAKDLKQKIEAEKQLRALYSLRDELKALPDLPLEGSGLSLATQQLKKGYDQTMAFAAFMQEAMKNSIVSEGSLGERERNNYLQTFQNLQF